MDLPQVVLDYNKKKGATKIAFLKDAKALHLKRFYSGSIGLNRMLGGGMAFKRVQLFYGPKSAGKNATINQMVAHNQRICRHCGKVLPEFYESTTDRWGLFLRHILRMDVCKCKESAGRVFLFYDYEKTLSLDNEPRIIKIRIFKYKATGEFLSENEYNDMQLKLDELKEDKKANKAEIVKIETWLENIDISFEEQEQIGAHDYLRLCGVNSDRLLVFAPEWLEDGIDSMREMIKSKQVDGIIWDSLQAAMPKYVGERSSEDATMGTEAKQNGLLMRQITAAYAPTDITDEREAFLPAVILTAQVRAKLGFLHAADSYSGGKAIEHFISSAIEFKRDKYLTQYGLEAKKGETNYGQIINLRADKNKLDSPNARCSLNYYFKAGEIFPVGFIDYFDEITAIAIENKVIGNPSNGSYTFKENKIRGFDNLVAKIRTEPDFCSEIYEEVKNLI